MERLYSKKDLLKSMKEAGLPYSVMWLLNNEKKGNLVCPRRPNSRGDRAFTQEQITQIIQAFSPNGKGRWGV